MDPTKQAVLYFPQVNQQEQSVGGKPALSAQQWIPQATEWAREHGFKVLGTYQGMSPAAALTQIRQEHPTGVDVIIPERTILPHSGMSGLQDFRQSSQQAGLKCEVASLGGGGGTGQSPQGDTQGGTSGGTSPRPSR